MKSNNKTRLSYSTINAIIECPHIWINKINQDKNNPLTLPITTSNMLKGRDAQKIVFDHLSGIKRMDVLNKLPDLPIVEKESFDKDVELRVDYGKYEIVGFVDARTKDWSSVGDQKAGKRWTPGDFNKLMQWRLYAFLKPEIKKFYLINTPFDSKTWTDENVLVYNTDVTNEDRQRGKIFIDSGISIIENIADQKLNYEGHHPYCWYPNCTFCTEPIPAYRL